MRLASPETLLTGLATGLTAASLWLPPSPWLRDEVRPLAWGLSSAWLLWRMWRLDRALAQRRAWHQSEPWELTPEDLLLEHAPAWCPRRLRRWWMQHHPTADVLLGKAFRWTAHHTQVLETALQQEHALPIDPGSRGGHPALHAVGRAQETRFRLSPTDLVGHTGFTATTRAGKSRGLQVLLRQAIAARGPGTGPVIVFDPKGDRELLVHAADAAAQAHRSWALVTTAMPPLSATMNPLATAHTPDELAMRIQALMPSAGGRPHEPFFEEFPLSFLESLATALRALHRPWTLTNLYAVALLPRETAALLRAYLLQRGVRPQADLKRLIGEYKHHGPHDAVADDLIEFHEMDRITFLRITSNLRPTFRSIASPPLGPLFSPATPDLTWRRIVDDDMVVYFSLAALLKGDTANRLGRVILQDFIGYLGWRYAYEPNIEQAKPITVCIDDVRLLYYPQFTTMLSMAGGAQARFILAQQSYADAEATVGKAAAEVILDNLNTQIYFRLGSVETATKVSKGLDDAFVTLPEQGASNSYGGVGGLSGSSRRSLRTQKTASIRPAWLRALPKGDFVALLRGEVWKGRVPLLTRPSDTRIAELGLTALWDALPPVEEVQEEADKVQAPPRTVALSDEEASPASETEELADAEAALHRAETYMTQQKGDA